MRMRLLMAMLALCLAAAGARGADTLRADFRQLGTRTRSGSPVWAEITLHWQGMTLLEGQLQVEIAAANEVVSRWESADMALATGEQRFRVLLPPWTPVSNDRTCDVRMRFVSKRRTFELPLQTLLVGDASEQVGTVAVCDPFGARTDLERSLRLEQFADDSPQAINTSYARFTPEEMPAQALGYCAFDLVYLAPQALGRLRERQLAALLQWARAGGSVLVAAGGAQEPPQTAFLNQLAELDYGCGVVLTNLVAVETDPYWRGTVARLWKLPFVNRWQKAETDRSEPSIESQLTTALMPHSVRPIPLKMLLGVLALFVALVGPLDYFGLGLLKRRRYTWLLFPLATFLCTAATIQLANHYLGRGDRRRALIIVDVGKDGRAVRENRIELAFLGRDRLVQTPVRNALWAPLSRRAQRHQGYHESEPLPALWHRGTFPGNYKVDVPFRQWEPQLHRWLSFEPSTPVPRINWDASDARQLAQGVRSDATAYLWGRGGKGQPSMSGRELLSWNQVSHLCVSTGMRLSPVGGPGLRDLALYDGTDGRQRLAVVVMPEGENILMFRRLSDVY